MHFEMPMTVAGNTGRWRLFGVVAVLIACLCGCQSAHVPDEVVAHYPGNDTDAQLNFWHTLAERRLTSNDDAFHGLLLYLDGTDPSSNYFGRVAALQKRGLLPANFHEPADTAVERGTMAVMIVKTLHIHGGWVMHVFGVTPRYAVKELVDQQLFTPSSPQQTFSGSEFVGVIGKLDDYQITANASTGSSSSGAEPAGGVYKN